MRILLTGNRGLVGRVLETDLRALGHEIVGYDRADGQDVLDVPALAAAMEGCQVVIHLAALLGSPGTSPHELMRVNLDGTWNVLLAAEGAGVGRVVYMSSVHALGVFGGIRLPDYLPLDGAHPCYPSMPYGISNRLAEEMCRFWSERTGVPTLCLRPPGVWTPDTYREIRAARQRNPSFEWSPYWEYGAFLDVHDLSTAASRAATCAFEGHDCFLLAAVDITTSGKNSREWVEQLCPGVEWRGGEAFCRAPYHSLIVTEPARRILGWEPRYTWRAFVEGETSGLERERT